MPIVVYKNSLAKYSYMINARSNATAEIKFENGLDCQNWLLNQGIDKVLFCEIRVSDYSIRSMKVVNVK